MVTSFNNNIDYSVNVSSFKIWSKSSWIYYFLIILNFNYFNIQSFSFSLFSMIYFGKV